MTQFIQIHFLTSYPPSNLNRDDLGRPKTAFMGGANRLRISSQSLKRAWRTSELFETALASHIGTRTKRMGITIYEKFIAKGVAEKQAREWAQKIAEQFGTLKKKKPEKESQKAEKSESEREKNSDLEIQQLVHFSPEEITAIDELIENCVSNNSAPSKELLKKLRKQALAVDIACFGRMLAEHPEANQEAAIQVAHAITTHAVDIEDDYFTAVDDLNNGLEDAGAGHLGETEFAAGLFYGYLCINRNLLKENLGGNEDLTQKTIASLLECVAKISPTGKQNSFASRAFTSYMLVEKGEQQPRSLAVSFLEPVKENHLLSHSINAFEECRKKMNTVYGACCDHEKKINVMDEESTLLELIAFAKKEEVK